MNSSSRYKAWIFLLIIAIFIATVTYLSTEISTAFEVTIKNIKIFNIDASDSSRMRVIKISNSYPFDINIFNEESDLDGSFLSILSPNEEIQVSTVNGNIIYATDVDGLHRISSIFIQSGTDSYIFTPTESLDGTGTNESNDIKSNDDHKDGGKDHDGGNELEYQVRAEHRDRPHSAVHRLQRHELASHAMAAKFRSLSGKKLNLWYDDGGEGTMQAHLSSGQETTTNTYVGHTFYATYADNRNEEISRFEINEDQTLYVINDDTHPASQHIIEQTRREEEFMADYYNKTGLHWRHYYGRDGPRPPPESFMWPGDEIGDVHRVTTTAGYWTCDEDKHCGASEEPITLELEVISTAPRAFIITNFLNDEEIVEIMNQAKPNLHLSQVGDVSAGIFKSNTRTSLNSWVQRKSSPVIENLYLRAAHLLRIAPELLYRNSEDMQVVHYEHGQKYDAHHDWGVSGYPESRFLTLLLYLNDPANKNSGGFTSFPKDGKGGGIKVHPGKHNAVLFYNLLEDGNGDDLALHSAMPVSMGEKWLANFWVWDPKKSRD